MVASAVLDSLDGAIARDGGGCDGRLAAFGENLDSLADVVSFGAAPAFAAYVAVMNATPAAGIAGCLAFFICGALRLARFPLVDEPGRFVGLPIPPAGLFISVLAAIGPAPLPMLAALTVTSALMVSTVPFPKPVALLGGKKIPPEG